ncbi:MAG: FkbM family methyltransferase [Haloferacaceae archaeon]
MFGKANQLRRIINQDGVAEGYQAVKRYVEWGVFYNSNNPIWSLKRGRILPTVGILSNKILRKNYFEQYLRKKYGRFLIRHINDYWMWIDLDDPGLSRDLISYGVREPRSSKALVNELRRMEQQNDELVTIMEIGANIGYYALLEATVLGDNANIHAFEPEPRNISLLQRNIELNGFKNVFTTHQVAVGDEPASVELEVTEKSNLNAVHSEGKDLSQLETRDTVSVPQVSVDEYVKDNGIDPEEVDLLRMDVEGHEYEIFKGMRSVFECDSDVVIFLETHFRRISEQKKHEIIDTLADSGFSIVHSARGFRKTSIRSFDDLRELGGEIILRRE